MKDYGETNGLCGVKYKQQYGDFNRKIKEGVSECRLIN